jgi:hypothetical protein
MDATSYYTPYMKSTVTICLLLLCAACGQHGNSKQETILLHYRPIDIQRDFDTLFHNQQVSPGLYKGFIEQALATCHSDKTKDSITQDVCSSMYLHVSRGQYDCVTTTTFQFPDGTIAAMGVFNLSPGDTIAPDHDFPITGGSGAYSHITGTYTRKYSKGVYHVALRYSKQIN